MAEQKGQPFSVRFTKRVDQFMELEAQRLKRSKSSLVEELATEAATQRRFPGVAHGQPEGPGDLQQPGYPRAAVRQPRPRRALLRRSLDHRPDIGSRPARSRRTHAQLVSRGRAFRIPPVAGPKPTPSRFAPPSHFAPILALRTSHPLRTSRLAPTSHVALRPPHSAVQVRKSKVTKFDPKRPQIVTSAR